MMNSIENSQNESANDDRKPSSSREIEKVQHGVDEVLTVMQQNFEKLVDRDKLLHNLDEKTEALLEGSSQFHCNAVQARRKMWWENMKMKIILSSLVALFLLILIIYLVVTQM